MLLSPVRKKSTRDVEIVAAYGLGTLGGALLTAIAAFLLSGFFEPLSTSARVAALGVGTGLIWAIKHGPLRDLLSLPENRRQIPSTVLSQSVIRGAARFGFEMGTGMRTYVPSMAPYVLLLALLLILPTLGATIFVALGFSLGRTFPLAARLLTPLNAQEAFALAPPKHLAGTLIGIVVGCGAFLLV